MLTDTQIRAAKARTKPIKLFDEKGLYLLVKPTGARLWRFKYRYPPKATENKEKLLALGSYPEVSLKLARDSRDKARRELTDGIDPGIKRAAEKHSSPNTFKAVACELFGVLRKASSKSTETDLEKIALQPAQGRKSRKRQPILESTIQTMERRLELHVFPDVGDQDISQVTGADLLAPLRRLEERGKFVLAHRVRSICGRVLRYGKATGRKCTDVAADLIGLLVPVEATHMATITDPIEVGGMLRAFDAYHGQPVTRLALQLLPYLFPRQIEFRTMEWAHLTLDGQTPEWRVPWPRMKMREPHIVPLSRQAVSLLRQIHPLTGYGRYVFPQLRKPHKPMSEMCITAALRAMGYGGEEMSAHGIRALASTLLNELGWNDKWIETQLAHGERNKVRAAYNHAKYLTQRRAMMQAWADYLDQLRAGKAGVETSGAERQGILTAERAAKIPDAYERFREEQNSNRT
jgi:integrase